ncbi:hypothetical protein [Microbacterium sp. HJ5]
MSIRTHVVEVARSVPLSGDERPRDIARTLQQPLVEGLDQATAERLARADRTFAARVAEWEARAGEKPARQRRLVTPWPDLVAIFAVASAMGAAAGAGRLTGGTPMNSLPVVAPTVVISLSIALLLLAAGALFARRERSTLLAQYEDSAAVSRSGFLGASAALSVVALIAMIVRLLTDDVFPLAVVATVMAGVTTVVTVALAISAYRLARASASGGKLIHRSRRTAQGSLRNEALSASEDARDQAADALEATTPSVRDELAAAYQEAVSQLAARKILPSATLKRLTPSDWIAARYDVET